MHTRLYLTCSYNHILIKCIHTQVLQCVITNSISAFHIKKSFIFNTLVTQNAFPFYRFPHCKTVTLGTWWRGDDDELAPPPAAVELGGDVTLRGDPPPPAVVTATVVLEDKWAVTSFIWKIMTSNASFHFTYKNHPLSCGKYVSISYSCLHILELQMNPKGNFPFPL